MPCVAPDARLTKLRASWGYIMKIELTQALVRAMSVRNRPRWVFDGRGNPKLVWETVPDGGEAFAPYVVFDNHKHAAPGFGVKVSRHVSAYIVQRRVDAKTVRKATIEKTSAISLTAARLRAQGESEALKRDGQSIKATQKERQGRVPTLRAIIGAYQDELRSREKPAKDSSLKNIDSALRRLELWHWADLPLTQISTKMVLERFEQEKVKKRTSTEQTCRWAYTATKAAIAEEVDRAVEGRRETAFTYNPFQILYTKKKFKTLAEWDADYVAKGLRNPLGDDDIGVVLDAIWKRRAVENNRTACDYLLLTLMSGTRRGELATLRWDEDGMAERTGANGKVWTVPGFTDTLFRCDDETRGGKWQSEGYSPASSRLRRCGW